MLLACDVKIERTGLLLFALALGACSASADDPDGDDMGNVDSGPTSPPDPGTPPDPGPAPAPGGPPGEAGLVGTWVGFEVLGIKRAAEYDLVVSTAEDAGSIEVGAMELRADGTMVLSDDETYARASSDWERTESGLWRQTQDGQLELIAQGKTAAFQFELDAGRLTIRDAENAIAVFERADVAPPPAPTALTSVNLYEANIPVTVDFPLAGDCLTCDRFDSRFFSFKGDGTMDIARVYSLFSSSAAIPASYPYLVAQSEVAVCGGRPGWSVSGDQLTMQLPEGPRTWTVRVEMFGAIRLQQAGIDMALLPNNDPFSEMRITESELLQICGDLGVPPAGFSPFTPSEWTKPQLRARTLDVDCPDGQAGLVGFLEGGVGGEPARGKLAGRVVIPSYPFAVHAVRFRRAYAPESNCLDTLAATVEVFRSTTTSPPASPLRDLAFATPARMRTEDRTVEVVFTTPLFVAAGEELFIAVEIEADGSASTCVAGCDGVSAAASNRSWIEGTDGWEIFATSDAPPFAFDFEAVGVSP